MVEKGFAFASTFLWSWKEGFVSVYNRRWEAEKVFLYFLQAAAVPGCNAAVTFTPKGILDIIKATRKCLLSCFVRHW